jgi:hypothetical protein
MSGARIFLGISVVVWLPYGIYCFLAPESLAEGAGVAFTNGTGRTELRAMYGGLQAAIGLLALAGFLKEQFTTAALLGIGFVAAGLLSTRLLGLALDGDFSAYTGGALGFEGLLVFFAFWLLRGRVELSAS